MLVQAYSHLLPHSDTAQTAYSSASTSAYIPDIPFDPASSPAAAHPPPNTLIAAHRHMRRQRTAPYPTLSIPNTVNFNSDSQPLSAPAGMHMQLPMHDSQPFTPASVHSLHSPQPVSFYNPIQNFSESTVYASQPQITDSWPQPSTGANGRIVRFNPAVSSAISLDGSAPYGTVEMFELTAKPSAASSSRPTISDNGSMSSPSNASDAYTVTINGSASSPATTPPLSVADSTPSTPLSLLANAASSSQLHCTATGAQIAVPSSPQPHMAALGFPAPPMVPPIPSTLPSSCYAQVKPCSSTETAPNTSSKSSGPTEADGNAGNANSELKQAGTDSDNLPPPQHTFPTPSELLSRLAAQDASDAREQRRQRRRKTKQVEAARTLGYLPTDPDAISTHDKKRFYLDCIEQYVIYLHEQLRLEKIEPVPVERVSSGRGLASRSIRTYIQTMIVHLQRTVARLHDQKKKAEERYNETRARLGMVTDFLQSEDAESSNGCAPNLGRRHSISYIPTAQQYTFP